jgi:ribosomal protein L40E
VSADRRCPNCGALVSDDAEWCGQCFTSLREPDPPPASPPAPANTTPATAEATIPQAAEPPSEEPVGAFWPCPVCGARNPIVLEACEICGTPFAAVMRGDTRRAADPQKAFARSLLFPGLGHAMLGYSIDGFARGAVFALSVCIAILLPLSVPTTGLVVLAVVLAVATAVGVYVLSAVETKQLAQRRGLLLSSKVLLWGGVGLMMVTVGAIALSVASETRR